MFLKSSVTFGRKYEAAESDDLRSFPQEIVVLNSLAATHGRRRAEPIDGVISSGGRTLNRRGENTTTRTVLLARPRIFSALHIYPTIVFRNVIDREGSILYFSLVFR